MTTLGVHHVAYRCKDAQATVDFYAGVLGLKYVMAMSEDRVPSTGELSPYMHIFFEVGPGSYVAFFELPKEAPMGRDTNTPDWVQHLALTVADMDTLLAMKEKLEGLGIDVVGPTDHALFMSIYFFDPNGHRLELTTNIGDQALWDKTAEMADSMLAEWNRTHGTVRQASFLHEKEMSDHSS